MVSKKISILFLMLISVGIVMKIFSPVNKLDSRLSYSVGEAEIFFQKLSPLETKHYFWAEILDLIFLGIYGILSFLIFKKFFPGEFGYLLFVPALLDLLETLLIIGKLTHVAVNLNVLAWASILKWGSGAILVLTLIYRYLRYRKIDA